MSGKVKEKTFFALLLIIILVTSPNTAQPISTSKTLTSKNATSAKAAPITIYDTRFLGTCLYIDTRPLTISAKTPARIPKKAYLTPLYSLKFLRRYAITVIITNDGRTTPSVDTNAPQKPATLKPTNVAELTAIGPGVLSAIAIISRISFSVIHIHLSTYK